MAITEDILVRLRVQGQQQFASQMGGAATQTERLGGTAKTTGGHVETTGKKAKTAGGRMAGFAGDVAKFAGATAALMAAQQIVKDSIGNAVNLGEQINKTAVVFRGPGAKSVQDWSKTTAKALGISQRQALESAGTLGNMLVPLGIGRTKAAEMSKGMVNLAADMASFNNASPEETLDALRSGIAGETEPLRKFGVFLSDARVKQEAMKQGLYDGKGPLDAQAKALATNAIILKDTKDAQGDFGKTSDSLANQQRILKARYEEATASLGQKLIPVLLLIVQNLGPVAAIVGVVTVGFVAFTVAGGTAAIAAGTFSVALFAIPLAIAAVVAGLIIAYKKVGWFRAGVNWLWGAVKTVFNWIKGHWPLLAAIFGGPIGAAVVLVIKNFDKIKKAATGVYNWVKTAFGNVVTFVSGLPGKIASAATGMWDGIKDAFRSALNWIINGWNSLEFKIPGFDPPGPGPKFGGLTLGVPNLPTLAAGGTISSGGAAIVGEAGPELVTLPTGASVTPGGGAIHTHVYLNGREIATAVGNAAADRKARR